MAGLRTRMERICVHCFKLEKISTTLKENKNGETRIRDKCVCNFASGY